VQPWDLAAQRNEADQQRAEDPQLQGRGVLNDASSGPLWSSTMTSWIIVNSRCVVGSSTGMRLFSTSVRISNVIATSAKVGSAAIQATRFIASKIEVSENPPVTRASTASASRKAGSVSAAK